MGGVAILVAGFCRVEVGEAFEAAGAAGGVAGEAAGWANGADARVIVGVV